MGSQQKCSCSTRPAPIVCERLRSWQDAIEMLPGAKLNFVSCRPPPLSLHPLPHSPSFLCLFRCSVSPSLHPMKGMQNHIWSFLFNQFFLFLRLSVLAGPTVSLCLYLITLPSCSDLFFSNFELNRPRLLSPKEVLFHTGGSAVESVNTPFKHARIKKDLDLSSTNSRIV